MIPTFHIVLHCLLLLLHFPTSPRRLRQNRRLTQPTPRTPSHRLISVKPLLRIILILEFQQPRNSSSIIPIQTLCRVVKPMPVVIYVTNDHYYREGLMRLVDDDTYHDLGAALIHVEISNLNANDSTARVSAAVAIQGFTITTGLAEAEMIMRLR
ncbi:hypothetical protein V1515DRAFT_612117 [Lipomyces mesembrius]